MLCKRLKQPRSVDTQDGEFVKCVSPSIVVHHGKMPGLMARLLIDVIDEKIVNLVINFTVWFFLKTVFHCINNPMLKVINVGEQDWYHYQS